MIDIQNEQLFQELDNEVAATCSGGEAFLYQDDGFRGRRLRFSQGTDDLSIYNFNDQTSSIVITGNRSWVVYDRRFNETSRTQPAITLPPGEYNRFQLEQRGLRNDTLSSLRRSDIPASTNLV